jgi:hypothetical protein
VNGGAYSSFYQAYFAKFGMEPAAFFGAHAYDAAWMILRALERTSIIDGEGSLHVGRQALRTALFATQGLHGATGTITCNPLGECGATGFRLHRVPPIMDLRVNYGHDWVESFYEAGHEVVITVRDKNENEKATVTVATEPKDFWDYRPGFQTIGEDWSPEQPDLQPGDRVHAQVDNGVTAQVQLGEIRGEVDIETDSITGTIEATWITNPVQVECLDWSGQKPPADNQDGGATLTDDADTYDCSWGPDHGWDIQPWQDVGVGYFTPDGHWVANAFHAEFWMAMWTHDLGPPFWSEGVYSYYFDWAYTSPAPNHGTSDPMAMTVSSGSEDAETPVYDGYVLLEPWASAPQLAWIDPACEVVPVVHPDQPTRFVWGWVNDFSMSYEEALEHFSSFTVVAYWDGETGGSTPLMMGELLPFTGGESRWEYVCSLTEHP